MPELPEVETTRRLLRPILGLTVQEVKIHRPSYVQGAVSRKLLLLGHRLLDLKRHGKQLLLTGLQEKEGRQRHVGLHLGMTGCLLLVPGQSPVLQKKHVQIRWRLEDGRWMVFHDPRRFGVVRTFAEGESVDAGQVRRMLWGHLGPDALRITPGQLWKALQGREKPLKNALMDQSILAGLGNIYADELLFRTRLHPLIPARRVDLETAAQLVREMRPLLRRAIAWKGSTIRDYVTSEGKAGGYQKKHAVYGRAGLKCPSCQGTLEKLTLGGRTTVYCGSCQPLEDLSSRRG